MKKLLLPLLAVSLFSACSSTQKITSVKATDENQVDGLPTEWGLPMRFSDSQSGIEYAVANDNNYVYLVYRITDKQTSMKMLTAGAKLWFDTDGGSDRDKQVEFPLKRDDAQPSMKEHERNRMIMMEDLLLTKNAAVTKGFLGVKDGKKSLDSIGDLQVKVLINNDESLVYEAAIPLKELYADNAFVAKKPLSIGLEINGMQMPQHHDRPEGGNGMGGGPRGGGSGGGMRPGYGGMRGGGGMHSGGGMSPGGGGFHTMESMSKAVKLEMHVLLTK